MALDEGTRSDSDLAAEDLIGQLKKLSVAAADCPTTSVCIKRKVSSLKFVHELEGVGIYSFCFEGAVSLEGFRGWVATNWVREKKAKTISTRPVGPSAFITVCETREDRDRLLENRVAQLRSSLLVHYPWKPQCDDPQFSPPEKRTSVEILSYPTWARDLLPEVFELIAPVLRISAAAKLLAVENPRATLLWDPSRPTPKTVGLEVEGDNPGDHSCKLLLPVRFLDLPNQVNPHQTSPPARSHLSQDKTPPEKSAEKVNLSKHSSSSAASAQAPASNSASEPPHPSTSCQSATSKDSWALIPIGFYGTPPSGLHSVPLGFPGGFPAAPIITEVSDDVHSSSGGKSPNTDNPTPSNQSIRQLLAQRRRGSLKDITKKNKNSERAASSDQNPGVDYRVLAADSDGQKGGVAILVHSSCAIKEWVAVNNRIIWAVIQLMNFRLPLVSVYAPVDSAERKLFWQQLTDVLPPKKFLFGGDWNVVEGPEDSSSRSNWLSRRETVNFFNFKASFHIHDVRKGGCAQKSLFFKIDPRILKDADLRKQVVAVWQKHKDGGSLDTPEKFLPAWSEFRSLIKETQYRESQQLSTLDEKKKRLIQLGDVGTLNQSQLVEFGALAEEVRRLVALQHHKFRLWSREKHLALGDTNSGYFLSRFKRRSAHGALRSLRLEDGTVVYAQNDINREVYSFFEKMYRLPDETPDILGKRQDLLSRLGSAVSPSEQAFLADLPTYREFSDILHSAPKGKAPGVDGFGYEVLADLWGELGEDFTLMMQTQEGVRNGKFAAVELPGGLKLDVSVLADDTAAFLAVQEKTFQEFLRLLEIFQSASGARINFTKSKILMIGRYSKPPDWLSSGPFKVLGRHQAARYLGITVASSLKPQDAWASAILSINERLYGLTSKHLNFEARCTVLRFLVQTKLSFAVSLATLRSSHLKTLRQLFRTFLWGTSVTGKPKVPLVAWELLSAPLRDGGLGIWDLPKFNLAFLVKYVSSLISKPLDASWPDIFWSLCRDNIQRLRCQFLLCGPSARKADPSFFSKMLDTWCAFRENLCWSPRVIAIPSLLSVDSAFYLLTSCGFISQYERDRGLQFLSGAALWGDLPDLGSYLPDDVAALWSKLLRLPVIHGDFCFIPQEWLLRGSGGTGAFPISAGAAYGTLVSSHTGDRLTVLNSKWGLTWSQPAWSRVFKLIWGKGVPRRDGLFLWKFLFKAFFTGRRVQRIGPFSNMCAECRDAPEDFNHIIACPARKAFWDSLLDICPILQETRPLFSQVRIPEVLERLCLLRPSDKLAAVLVFSHALRLCWRRRCELQFDGSGKALSSISPLISFVEVLLAEGSFASGPRKDLCKGAIQQIFACSFFVPNRFLKDFDRLFQD
ncbi:hypothetical protein R1sor_026074 [Riccia sorocarpa]|uniref:Reverse transcriptase zinc-binding domain-containing protein n=1 Tax=Riccia sorocarpa TaxID=122646 RepID=A0ABD3GBY1_9MARC